mmetsp:Transcript_40161/g.83966  ORF Transcript_40161/g.83966 Transcript_40161/m.83966 type:complete len:89 (-) Transcript_40161:1964-2230(-)
MRDSLPFLYLSWNFSFFPVRNATQCTKHKQWLGMTDRQHLELINGYFQYAGGFEPRKAFDITATLPNKNRSSDPMFIVEAIKAKKRLL